MKHCIILAGLFVTSTAMAQINPDPVWVADPSIGPAFVDISGDGETLVLYPAGSNRIKVVNLVSGSVSTELDMEPYALWFGVLPLNGNIRFSPDGRYCAANTVGEIRIWSTEDWSLQLLLEVDGPGAFTFATESSRFVSADGREVVIRDLETLEETGRWSASWTETAIARLQASADESLVAVATGWDPQLINTAGPVTVCQLTSGELVNQVTADTTSTMRIAFSTDNATLFVSYSYGGRVQLIGQEPDRGETLARFSVRGPHQIDMEPGFQHILQVSSLGGIGSILTADESRTTIYRFAPPTEGNGAYAKFTGNGSEFLLWQRASPTNFGLFEGRVPVILLPPERTDDGLQLQWTGRKGTFQLQQTSTMNGVWTNTAEPTAGREITVPTENSSAFFRLQEVGQQEPFTQ